MNRQQNAPAALRRSVPWSLVLSLGALALVRPLMSATGVSEAIGSPWAQLGSTVLITVAWVSAVVVARVPRPFLTLVLTGLVYGVLAILLSAVLSPILTGGLQGPITNPFAMVSVLLTNALWGTAAGGLALAFRAVPGRGSVRG